MHRIGRSLVKKTDDKVEFTGLFGSDNGPGTRVPYTAEKRREEPKTYQIWDGSVVGGRWRRRDGLATRWVGQMGQRHGGVGEMGRDVGVCGGDARVRGGREKVTQKEKRQKEA